MLKLSDNTCKLTSLLTFYKNIFVKLQELGLVS